MILPAVAAGAVASAGLAMSGCVVSVGNSRSASYTDEQNDYIVTSHELQDIIAATRVIDLGMGRHEVLDSYKPRLLTKFSTSVVDGYEVEEWRVKASHGRSAFQRWFYFVDGRLEAFDYHRIDSFAPEGSPAMHPGEAGTHEDSGLDD